MHRAILQIEDLHTYFFTFRGTLRAVDGVSEELRESEILGIVGETGCGKSVTALSAMKLIPAPGKIIKGKVLFEGQNLLKKSDSEMRKIRGKKISMIFQNPLSSLNPVFTIGDQVSYIIGIHQKCGRRESRRRAMDMFHKVQLPDVVKILKKYPHELSGGMLQRIMIAMALSCVPQVLIADEPTTALDVTIQAQILSLISDLRRQINTSILLITHDLGVVAEVCDRVAVMYAGRIVEKGKVKDIFRNPLHPYTRGLMKSIPRRGRQRATLETIDGVVPDLLDPPQGCLFHPRCKVAAAQCRQAQPFLQEKEEGHFVACSR